MKSHDGSMRAKATMNLTLVIVLCLMPPFFGDCMPDLTRFLPAISFASDAK